MLPVAALPNLLPVPVQDVEVLYAYGDPVPGMGDLTHVLPIDLNAQGEWMAWVKANVPNSDRDTAIVAPGGVVLREHDLVPDIPFTRIDSFEGMALHEDPDLVLHAQPRPRS